MEENNQRNADSDISKISVLKLEDKIFEFKDKNPIIKFLFNNNNIGILTAIEQEEIIIKKVEKKFVARSFSKPKKESYHNKSIGVDFESMINQNTNKKNLKVHLLSNKKNLKINPQNQKKNSEG